MVHVLSQINLASYYTPLLVSPSPNLAWSSFQTCVLLTVNQSASSDNFFYVCEFLSLPRFLYPEDGGDMFLRNVGFYKINAAPHFRRRHSS
jgi:hypothetical protein